MPSIIGSWSSLFWFLHSYKVVSYFSPLKGDPSRALVVYVFDPIISINNGFFEAWVIKRETS
jgi:hypothetical protein|tara:strand:+ start:174 stop:359 length:186 start_codon:yes stop_codon:yes gene_type:complete